MGTIEILFLTILIGLLAVSLFFILRNIVLWYLRINDRFAMQNETNQLLTEILKELKSRKE